MTNLLLSNPDAIMIHIPKTGFTSVRSFWDLDNAKRAFGHIPKGWPDLPTFACVRHPKARFLSAVRMFKFGNPDYDDYFKNPTLPDLTIESALDIIEDDTIAYDRSSRTPEATFKHHALRQTHPFNCLALAKHIMRLETIDADFEGLKTAIGLTGTLPHLRKSGGTAQTVEFPDDQYERFKALYHEDYTQLGYGEDGAIIGELNLKPHPDATIYGAWPGFFGQGTINENRARNALPAPRVDLNLFLEKKVQGKSGSTWPGREKNLIKHFHKLQPEFFGKSRLAHLLACTIVTIRRTKGRGPGIGLFHRITSQHGPHLCEELNARWLVSVCDTFADHGKTSEQRAIAMTGSVLLNSVKLFETERQTFYPERPWPPNRRFAKRPEIFDGIIPFWIEGGDMVANLLHRIRENSKLDPIAGQFTDEIVNRIMKYDTSFSRLAQLANQEPVPKITDETHEMFRAQAFDLL